MYHASSLGKTIVALGVDACALVIVSYCPRSWFHREVDPKKRDSLILVRFGDGTWHQEVQSMSRKRRVLGAALKAKVALVAVRGDRTTAQLASGRLARRSA
jgi:hypothetical protein